ncbi:anthranilate synthase family protein [Symbioplanes lichenis]|uniref:anthranilate synthase family protein n=1 Tax=Symbioplanes lichenis TaxID=1629072 RepID=UPI00273A4D8E|nr:chorismate-binding protein [Actinoplanes lichenis]
MTNAFALLRRAPDRVELLTCEPADAPGDREPTNATDGREPTGAVSKRGPEVVPGKRESADSSDECEPTDAAGNREPTDAAGNREPTDASSERGHTDTIAPGERETLTLLPYRNLAGDTGAPATVLTVTGRTEMTVAEAVRRLPVAVPRLEVQGFDRSDAEYEALVQDVISGNIARGDGSNFVLRRTLRARYDDWSADAARALFRRFLLAERGAYWTFVVHVGGRTVAGMSPECHVRLRGGRAVMNPISGTWRFPPGGADPGGLERFLADGKETGELLMVLDEELKMMARVCDRGLPRVDGPRLRVMSRLAHTEYLISGPTSRTPAEVLRLTTPAPTVTGSPVARACEVIATHEGSARGIYGGVLALSSPGDLDSVLLIRTAEITADGQVTAGVGATLVRGSDPRAEARETHAKAAALLAGLRGDQADTTPTPQTLITSAVRHQLRERNAGLSRFWLPTADDAPTSGPRHTTPKLRTGVSNPRHATQEPHAGAPNRHHATQEPHAGAPDPRDAAQEPHAGAPDPLHATQEPHAGAPDPRHTRQGPHTESPPATMLENTRLLIIDAGDDFTQMLARMAESLGAHVHVRSWRDTVPSSIGIDCRQPETRRSSGYVENWRDTAPPGVHIDAQSRRDTVPPDSAAASCSSASCTPATSTSADVVLLGPGPGDPLDRHDPRVDRLHRLARSLLAARTPLVAVCLGHQVLAAQLGLLITRKSEPAQGVRADVTLGGRRYSVGFYNSFAAVSAGDILDSPLVTSPVRVVRDPASGTVHALAGPGIRSAQFHVESVLTEHGPDLLRGMLAGALTDRNSVHPAVRSGEDARLTVR